MDACIFLHYICASCSGFQPSCGTVNLSSGDNLNSAKAAHQYQRGKGGGGFAKTVRVCVWGEMRGKPFTPLWCSGRKLNGPPEGYGHKKEAQVKRWLRECPQPQDCSQPDTEVATTHTNVQANLFQQIKTDCDPQNRTGILSLLALVNLKNPTLQLFSVFCNGC